MTIMCSQGRAPVTDRLDLGGLLRVLDEDEPAPTLLMMNAACSASTDG